MGRREEIADHSLEYGIRDGACGYDYPRDRDPRALRTVLRLGLVGWLFEG